VSSIALKKELLRLLETDEEFRLAVAGLIGLREILDELKRLREDFNKLYQKSLEHDKRFEEINKRFEVIEHKLLEHDKRFEAIERKLLEHDKRLDELNKRVSHVEDMVGALAESTYAKFVLEAIASECAAIGDRVVGWERNAVVDDREIDLLIETEKRVFVVEIKVKPRESDVDELLAKASTVSKQFVGKEVIPVLAGARIGREVTSYARGRGVRVYRW